MIFKNSLYFDKAVRFLGSLKFSFILLFLLLVVISQRAIIAQKSVFRDTDVAVPWIIDLINSLGIGSARDLDLPFYIILFFFAVNLLFSSISMWRRIRIKNRALSHFKNEEEINSLHNKASLSADRSSSKVLQVFLKKQGLQIVSQDTTDAEYILAGKRLTGRWGVLFFHLAFFLVLIGALISVSTRFTGYVELTPGKMFTETRENYNFVSDPPIFGAQDRWFSIRLEDLRLAFWRPGTIKQRSSVVSIFDSTGNFIEKKEIAVNSPYAINGLTIYQGSNQGFVAGLEVIDQVGTVATGTARFKITDKLGVSEPVLWSVVNLPGTSLHLYFELFTNELNKIEGLETLALQHNASLIKVYAIETEGMRFQGVVFGGGALDVEGVTLKFVSLAPYTSFVLVQDYGVAIIFTGFFFLLIGLLMTYFWVPETYWAVIKQEKNGERVIIGATTEKYKEAFRERFVLQMQELERVLM